jgi:hypothetical protein
MADSYIYNRDKNLRTTFARVNYFPIHMPGMGPVYLATVNCQDKCIGNWDMKKSYTGLVAEKHNTQAIQQIMHCGSSTKIVRDWLSVGW